MLATKSRGRPIVGMAHSRLAPRCNVCGLDYSFADPADGPAFFVMMTMAFPVTAFGIWVELAYEPPLWVHFVTTLPMLLIACIPILRPIKGVSAIHKWH